MLEDSMEQLAEAENRAEDLNKQLAKAKGARKRAESRLERVMDEIRRAKAEKAASYDDDAATDTSTSVLLGFIHDFSANPVLLDVDHDVDSLHACGPVLTRSTGTASRTLPRVLRSSSRLRLWRPIHPPTTCVPSRR